MHSYSSPPYPSQFFLHVASWPSQAIRCVSGNHLHDVMYSSVPYSSCCGQEFANNCSFSSFTWAGLSSVLSLKEQCYTLSVQVVLPLKYVLSQRFARRQDEYSTYSGKHRGRPIGYLQMGRDQAVQTKGISWKNLSYQEAFFKQICEYLASYRRNTKPTLCSTSLCLCLPLCFQILRTFAQNLTVILALQMTLAGKDTLNLMVVNQVSFPIIFPVFLPKITSGHNGLR